MDQITKSLLNCYNSVKISIIKSNVLSQDFLENSKISNSLGKVKLQGILDEINQYYEDQVKSKLRQNRFVDKEASHFLEKTSFNKINEIVAKYLGGDDNNHPLQQFLNKNSSRFIEKSNMNEVLKEIEEIIRLQEEHLVKFAINLKESPLLEKNNIEKVCKTLQKDSIIVEKFHCSEKNSVIVCEKIISNLSMFDSILENGLLERNNLNHTLICLSKIHVNDLACDEKKNISVDDLNQFENSNQQRNEGMSYSNQNPFLESQDGDVVQNMSILEPAEDALKSMNKHSHMNSIDGISRLEHPQTPIKPKRVTPERTSDIVVTDPKHQYVSTKLRRTLNVFNNFNKEVDELITLPQIFTRKMPNTNISSIKKIEKAKETPNNNNNVSIMRSGSCRNSLKKSLNFNSIREKQVKALKESVKSNSFDSPRMRIGELEFDTDTPRFLRTDLISKLLSFSEEDLKNIAMKNLSPQKPLPPLKSKGK